ncbi:glycoside hydrolase family 18 protein, partial [Piscirickettsia litoralis]|uniref:glycoside hydrolase family 18 protein n=1 Tax=Piscirickettsia litoralis TaxID=1891921 RepID=UPI00138FBB45
YLFTADALAGKWAEYQAQFLDQNPVTILENQQVRLRVSYKETPVMTEQVVISAIGLPEGKTAQINLNDSEGNQFSVELKESEDTHQALPINRQYQVNTVSFTIDGKTYVAESSLNGFLLQKDKPLNLVINYNTQNTQFVAYWGGWNNYTLTPLAESKVTVVNLSFADIKLENGNYRVDTSVSGYLTDVPRANSQIWPNYQTWTQYAHAHPETKFMLSVGGATFSRIWTQLLTVESVEAIADSLVDKLTIKYPVYSGNFARAEEKIGEIELAGIDLDVEASGQRVDERISRNVIALIKALKARAPNKLITFAGFSVGADPEGQCTVPGSVHCGEDRQILQQAGQLLNWVNVMAYDAGEAYARKDYQIALQNYAGLIGKQKTYLGLDLQPQWGVAVPETPEQLAEKAKWAVEHGYGGVMLWAIINHSVNPYNYVMAISKSIS